MECTCSSGSKSSEEADEAKLLSLSTKASSDSSDDDIFRGKLIKNKRKNKSREIFREMLIPEFPEKYQLLFLGYVLFYSIPVFDWPINDVRRHLHLQTWAAFQGCKTTTAFHRARGNSIQIHQYRITCHLVYVPFGGYAGTANP